MIIIDQAKTIYNGDNIVFVSMQQSTVYEDIWLIMAKLVTGELVELAAYSSHDKCKKEFGRYRMALWDEETSYSFREDC